MADMRMGLNLGFIAHIQLVDGTIINNMQVLYNAPIPRKEQIEKVFDVADKFAGRECGKLDDSYSRGITKTA